MSPALGDIFASQKIDWPKIMLNLLLANESGTPPSDVDLTRKYGPLITELQDWLKRETEYQERVKSGQIPPPALNFEC